MTSSHSYVISCFPCVAQVILTCYHLQYTEDVWGPRISAVTRRASSYYKYTLELIWLIATFAAVIAGPIVVYHVALSNIPEPDDNDKDKDDHFRDSFDRYWKARLIAMGTFLGLMIITFVPMHMWKNAGKKAVNQMLQRYEEQDRAARPGAPFPTMRMKMPGVVTKNIVCIDTPVQLAESDPDLVHTEIQRYNPTSPASLALPAWR